MLQRGGLRHRWPAGSSSGVWRVVKPDTRRSNNPDTAIWKGIALVPIGLIGYVLWRFVQAIKTLKQRHGRQGLAQRLGYAVNGLIYAGFSS